MLDTGSDAIDWVLSTVRSWGLNVVFSDTLRSPYAADRSTGTILIPSGLPWPRVHSRIDRALLYMIGGESWAPEFTPQPEVSLAPVVPILRRPW